MLGGYVQAPARSLAVYTDKASLFQAGPKAVHHRQAPEAQPTQIGWALRNSISSGSLPTRRSQGRVERFFSTAQDRLVKGLRKVGPGIWGKPIAIWTQGPPFASDCPVLDGTSRFRTIAEPACAPKPKKQIAMPLGRNGSRRACHPHDEMDYLPGTVAADTLGGRPATTPLR